MDCLGAYEITWTSFVKCNEKYLWCLLVHQVCTSATFHMIQPEQNFCYVVILQEKKKKNRVNKLLSVLPVFSLFFSLFCSTESLSSFK